MNPNRATVVKASRRWIELITPDGDKIPARSSTKALEITVGDSVTYLQADDDYVIDEILPRKNQLERKNASRSKIFAANVDQLFIVTCVGPIFNTGFIDRALITALDQHIPATLILNKIDLSDPFPQEIAVYKNIGVPIIETSTKTNQGIDALSAMLENASDSIVVFCGMSGVGKSSLLNKLIPGCKQDTADVSRKTGQGTQTTSQSEAFPYLRAEKEVLQIIDLPGFSQFGMAHVPLEYLSHNFPEFKEALTQCAFSDCSHDQEPNCGVKKQIELGLISQFRYQNYLEIRNEIKSARSY